MDIIYVSSDNTYCISKGRDMLWESIFGKMEYWNVCKYDENLKDVKFANFNGWFIIKEVESLKEAFRYLKNNQIISIQEYKNQCELFNL